jgi:hypothetical protein
MLADKDLVTLKGAVELLWAKGTHSPKEAAVAFTFTQLVERLIKEMPPVDKAPEGSGK